MPPNILLIIMDSCRAKNCSVYGYGRSTTPNLEKLSKTATTYTQMRSPGIWSLPSHTSIFTGSAPHEHQILSRNDTLEPGYTVWERIKEKYSTGVFSDNPFITQNQFGLNRGFDTIIKGLPRNKYSFDGLSPESLRAQKQRSVNRTEYFIEALKNKNTVGSLINGLLFNIRQLTTEDYGISPANSAKHYTTDFLRWIGQVDEPWAACINFLDAHYPYQPTERCNIYAGETARQIQQNIDDHRYDFYADRLPWWQLTALEALYDGGIRQIDEQIGRIINNLQNRDIFDNTLIVVTSDHGEGFGEFSRTKPGHRAVEHKFGIHEVYLHVPCIVKLTYQENDCMIQDIGSIRNFPHLVDDIIKNRSNRHTLTSKDEILVYSGDQKVKHSPQNAMLLNEYPELSIENFAGDVWAQYTQLSNGEITKSCKWKSDEAEVIVRDAQTSYKISNNIEHEFPSNLEDTAVDGMKTESKANIELNENIKNHLDDLGYV